jgi:hypothetical protein
MTCTIIRPDPQELFDRFKNMFSSTVLGGGKVIPESNEWYVVANDYAAAEQFYAIADQLWRESDPATACCDNLYKIAAQHGVFPYPAAHAEGYAKLTGVPGSAVPQSFEIQTNKGTFVSVGSVPLSIPDSGEVVVRIRALTPGSDMNALPGEMTTGTLTTPAPGINPEVAICGGSICSGADAESCEQFRKRYMERLAYKPRATMAWIKEKILEFPCTTRVCVREGTCCRCGGECGDWGCKNCGNMMQFYVFFDGTFPCGIPPQHIIDDITDWLFGVPQGYGLGQVEIGVCGQIIQPKPLWINVIIDIVGCPTAAQKQQIEEHVAQLFTRICPSVPFRVRQAELIVANVVGTDIDVSVRFEVVGQENFGGNNWLYVDGVKMAWISICGDIEPECDVIPCLNEIRFTEPETRKPPC